MKEMIDVKRLDAAERTQHMKFRRATAEAITKPSRNSCFSVLHAWRHFREQDVALGEMRKAFTHFAERSFA